MMEKCKMSFMLCDATMGSVLNDSVLDQARIAFDFNPSSFHRRIKTDIPVIDRTIFIQSRWNYKYIFDREDSISPMLMILNNAPEWKVSDYMTNKGYLHLTSDTMNDNNFNNELHNAKMNYQYRINMSDREM